MGNFRDLNIWKDSKNLAVLIYQITNEGRIAKDYGLRDQMRRAAVSIPSNIAEGEESGFDKLSLRYFHNAKASLAELFTQIQIAYEIECIELYEYQEVVELIDRNAKQIKSLIKYRQKNRK